MDFFSKFLNKDMVKLLIFRLTTVKNADRIIVLDDGHIVEEGAPEELLAREGSRFQKVSL